MGLIMMINWMTQMSAHQDCLRMMLLLLLLLLCVHLCSRWGHYARLSMHTLYTSACLGRSIHRPACRRLLVKHLLITHRLEWHCPKHTAGENKRVKWEWHCCCLSSGVTKRWQTGAPHQKYFMTSKHNSEHDKVCWMSQVVYCNNLLLLLLPARFDIGYFIAQGVLPSPHKPADGCTLVLLTRVLRTLVTTLSELWIWTCTRHAVCSFFIIYEDVLLLWLNFLPFYYDIVTRNDFITDILCLIFGDCIYGTTSYNPNKPE